MKQLLYNIFTDFINNTEDKKLQEMFVKELKNETDASVAQLLELVDALKIQGHFVDPIIVDKIWKEEGNRTLRSKFFELKEDGREPRRCG